MEQNNTDVYNSLIFSFVIKTKIGGCTCSLGNCCKQNCTQTRGNGNANAGCKLEIKARCVCSPTPAAWDTSVLYGKKRIDESWTNDDYFYFKYYVILTYK